GSTIRLPCGSGSTPFEFEKSCPAVVIQASPHTAAPPVGARVSGRQSCRGILPASSRLEVLPRCCLRAVRKRPAHRLADETVGTVGPRSLFVNVVQKGRYDDDQDPGQLRLDELGRLHSTDAGQCEAHQNEIRVKLECQQNRLLPIPGLPDLLEWPRGCQAPDQSGPEDGRGIRN